MNAPFLTFLTWPQRWLLLTVLLALSALLLFGRIASLDEFIKARGEGGIMALQFAGSADRAAHLLVAWRGLEDLLRSQTRWDFLFLLVYPAVLSLACAMLAEARGNPLPTIGIFVAWLALAAIPLDAIENLATLRMIDHGASEPLARWITVCATMKFAIVLTAAGYLLVAGIATLFQR
ncbi:MAG TPA: hypothetical protein PKX14_11795 [Thauera aminoaromatica]|nr:hypothetical protein [Thauera aminoaromatica]HNC67341.1 hypothetical protein [Thauera aminoaromatica]HNF77470.1 hypothetical protein [Thauera aminoaromatica]